MTIQVAYYPPALLSDTCLSNYAVPQAPSLSPAVLAQGGCRSSCRGGGRCRGGYRPPPHHRLCPLHVRARLALLHRSVATLVRPRCPPLWGRRRRPARRLHGVRRRGQRSRYVLRYRHLHRRMWPRLSWPPPALHQLHRSTAGRRAVWRACPVSLHLPSGGGARVPQSAPVRYSRIEGGGNDQRGLYAIPDTVPT